jgi:hypothetical protein
MVHERGREKRKRRKRKIGEKKVQDLHRYFSLAGQVPLVV